jgi:hypothetical protein
LDREKWEYYTAILRAELKGTTSLDYRQLRWASSPGGGLARYSPLALIPELDELGRAGWELLSIQPVIAGDNEDIFIGSRNSSGSWTNAYLCAFKRRAG